MKRNKTEKSGIEKQLRNIESKSKHVREQIDFLQKQMRSLMGEAGAKDEDEFRRRERLFSERERRVGDIARAKRSIRQIAGESDLDRSEIPAGLPAQVGQDLRRRGQDLGRFKAACPSDGLAGHKVAP